MSTDTRPEGVWASVKAALQEYGKQYPHTVVGKFINRLWGNNAQ